MFASVKSSRGARRVLRTLVVPTLAAGLVGVVAPAPAQAAGWHQVATDCFDKQSTAVNRTICYRKWKLGSDGNGSYDFYALEIVQTASARAGYKLQALKVAAKPMSTSPAMSLYGVGSYYPRTRISGTPLCRWTFGLTISTKAFSVSGSRTLCTQEHIDWVNPVPTANVGDFGARWHTDGSRSGSRSVEANGVVRVRQGQVAKWAVVSSSDATACRVYGPLCQGVYH